MLKQFVTELQRGRLFGPHLDSFVVTVTRLGYARSSVRQQALLLRDLERWLERKSLALADLDEQVTQRFLEKRRRQGRLWKGHARAVSLFLEHLRQKGAIPTAQPVVDDSPLAVLQKRYEDFLKSERGLASMTATRYGKFLRRFLCERFGNTPIRVRKLVPNDISEFLLRHARSGTPGEAKLMVTMLRSIFRFLFQHGETDVDLTGAVPTVRAWRLADVPKYLAPEEVERVIQACERRSPCLACRDRAIMLLLARLGLRAGEVIALVLDDIDWRAGVLTVRGKGGHHDRLPLPADVGEAIATYLRSHRPRCTTRRVFIRIKAPHRGFANPSSISTIVCRALDRAGLQPSLKGAHILRHSLATGMLRSGASMDEIGEILRHRTPNSTEIYAKVDINSLRSLALPWPMKGGAR
jgi:integrase/recombinase XerD